MQTKKWYSGSTGANQKRIRNWAGCPSMAKRYAAVHLAESAGYMIEKCIGEGTTSAYLLVESEGNHYAIRFARDRGRLVENDFELRIGNPNRPLANLVNN